MTFSIPRVSAQSQSLFRPWHSPPWQSLSPRKLKQRKNLQIMMIKSTHQIIPMTLMMLIPLKPGTMLIWLKPGKNKNKSNLFVINHENFVDVIIDDFCIML